MGRVPHLKLVCLIVKIASRALFEGVYASKALWCSLSFNDFIKFF
jgi:hypothetical protein